MDLQKGDGWSALMSPSKNGHGEVVKLPLENGAQIDLQKENRLSALISA